MSKTDMTPSLDRTSLEFITRPQPRLPYLKQWLIEEVWTMQRFEECGGVPSEYLKAGEKLVNDNERLLTASAFSYYNELSAAPNPNRSIIEFFEQHPQGSVVVLDGCSLRELPRFIELAKNSNRPVVEYSCGRSAIPSTTEHFIKERLGFHLPSIGPSQLITRQELKDHGLRYHYFQTPNESQYISNESGPILLWQRFPDLRFMDSTASNADLYDGIWDSLELVWKNTVQALPVAHQVLVTSDHGYVFLGAGLSDTNLEQLDKPLKGKRFREFEIDESLPDEETTGLFVDPARRLAVIQGRCHNRPQAPSPSKSLYRHGGISLMECLTPWLVLGPME